MPRSLVLPVDEAAKVKRIVLKVLQRYSVLTSLAEGCGELLFSVTPKSHWHYHLGDRVVTSILAEETAAWTRTLSDGSRTLSSRLSMEPHYHSIPEKVLEKYCTGMHLMNVFGLDLD